MGKQSVGFITLLLIMMSYGSYAAFPVVPKTAASPTIANETPKQKTFAQRRVPQYVEHLKHSIFPHNAPYHSGKSGWAGIVAISCSIAALITFFAGSIVFLPLCIAGIIFGAIGLGKRKHTNTGWALAGLLLGSIMLVATVLLIILIAAAFSTL